jgi:O-antigen/teichoic acid export membrane protein
MSLVIIIKNNGYQIVNLKFPFNELKKYFSEFYIFSSPLFLSGVVALICGVLDRWLLQFFSGSVQQGFYGFSFQIGMVCFIFTSAMTPLIMREFSIAFNQKNINQISNLFRKYIPLLYGIAAYISCFIAFQAAKIIHIMGGEEYKDAALAVAIMSIYPIHQTYGQLSGSVFMATGQTRLYGKIAIIFMVLGLPLTYFLIASKSNMGIDAGATGLAVKMVIIQIVSVNVQLYFNSKYLNLKFWRYFIHQFASLIILLAVSFLSMILIDKIFVINEQIISFLVSGIIYTILVITLVYFKPIIMGLSRVDILYIVDQIKTRIR